MGARHPDSRAPGADAAGFAVAVYLDGRVLAIPAPGASNTANVALSFPSNNGLRASDFETWFYLTRRIGLLPRANGFFASATAMAGRYIGVIDCSPNDAPLQRYIPTCNAGLRRGKARVDVLFLRADRQMKNLIAILLLSLCVTFATATPAPAVTADGKAKIVLIAGKPSHPPRMHEFHAGSLLLQKCLANVPGLVVEVHEMGWVKDEKTFDDADAVIIYADGGKGHPALQGDHQAKLASLIKKGVGFACMHYGVEVPADTGGPAFKQWIGGYYEDHFSCNPIWEPKFDHLPEHPITRGVKPFQIRDEWYINMRFADGLSAEKPVVGEGMKFWPILVAAPSDKVRNGPYVAPKGPYPHIVAASGRVEAMMWAIERPDGGRGFGFTGGHFHDNWGNDDFRKTILNAMLWVAKVDVPAGGVESKVTKEELDQNLDPKGKKK